MPIIVVIIVLGRFLECKDNDQRLKVEPVEDDDEEREEEDYDKWTVGGGIE